MRWCMMMMLTALLPACMSLPEHCSRLSISAHYCLSTQAGPAMDADGLTQVAHGDDRFQLLSRLQVSGPRMQLAGVSPLGQTLLKVDWDNGQLSVWQLDALKGKLPPALLPALMQLAFWPVEQVRRGLSDGVQLVEDAGGRRLMQDGQDVLRIQWQGSHPPYSRLRFELPAAGVIVDTRQLEEGNGP
ncbi:DUF3261 domain-containing protein [Leeia aquatica]|uniref:DUF3261 domain-containing protein n=1 Tax=Leeia aquatica TaxID=2725557 RepID=A0A847SF91_9NEIS|nr:DUF3261 domain-containing protein [Leeia aquatica]NLR76096.1 DUF3261 domain-containing protein [Leeia aquatica]